MRGRCNCSSSARLGNTGILVGNLYRNSTAPFAERDQKGFYYTRVSPTTTTSTATSKGAARNRAHKYFIPEKTSRAGLSAESRAKN